MSAWLALALLAASCQFSLPQLRPAPTFEPTASEAPVQRQPLAMVTFEVQLPQNTPLGEPVFLSMLDETTGLALNVTRHAMQASDDYHYEVSLPFPVGSIIKYRYSRQATYTADEHTSIKRPVRYRMYSVQGPGRVRDVISAWSDTAMSGPTGRIMGTAIDAKTSESIPNLLILAGGFQALTAADGSFLLEGLPPGTHNLVAYAMDGSYQTFQQGAVVAAESTTPAPLQLKRSKMVNLVFNVSVPQATMPGVPIRMAGNLLQLGNTFADLAGGVSTLASRMPILTPLPEGGYSLAISLPAGSHITYKYSLGDGFWNAEHTAGGGFLLRNLVVPEQPEVIEDQVESWGEGEKGPLLFDLRVPSETPETDLISIQFNPYGWTEPLPMWSLGEGHWVYLLYSPLSFFEKIGYRYCRNDQCGSADDLQTPGPDSFGRIQTIETGHQTINDMVEGWIWLGADLPQVSFSATNVRPREDDFMAGVEFQPAYHPSWNSRLPVAYKHLQTLGANWVVLSPTWTYTRQSAPMLEIVTGQDPLWTDVSESLERAQAFGFNAAIFPTHRFPINPDEWWSGAPRNFAWWVAWFERYRSFVLHHADLAEIRDVQALILGGETVSPALPGGVLWDGSPSGVPLDAEIRWRALLDEVRQRYTGQLIWALPFGPLVKTPPAFIDSLDLVYLLWSAPLTDDPAAAEQTLQERVAALLDAELQTFQAHSRKPLILGVAYPSADGALTGCLPDPLAIVVETCLPLDLLSRPNPDIASVEVDLEEQARAYQALLLAINERHWISGFISRGYYPPAALQDKSSSINGKPAEAILQEWFPRLLGNPSP
ncbi:MAG TPA: hypothetical protein VJ436_04225 [Anaerolineales bacterium]|nr:hypothetical protein [Anaerolineales bacterium]